MGEAATTRTLSDAQRRCIFALGHKAALDNDALHNLIFTTVGQESVTDLTLDDGKKVIDRLKILTDQEDTTPRGRATRHQQDYIRDLAIMLGWDDGPRRLTGFLESRFKVSAPNFLTPKAASNCIEALKAMVKNGRGERKRKA